MRKLLTVWMLLASGCSTLVMRTGQPTVIGEVQPSSPRHVLVTNAAGQTFRIPRASISNIRLGGQRTVLWSLLAGSGFLILGPVGLVQWLGESMKASGVDASDSAGLEVPDAEEVLVSDEVQR